MTPSQELDHLAASVLMFGFDGLAPNDGARTLLAHGAAGVILFKRNVGTPAEVFALTSELRGVAGRPLLLAVDQEGGRVARLREGFTAIPPLREVGHSGNEKLAEEIGRILGSECRAVGFNLDFAPVVDVDSNPQNPVIGDRSFGGDPALCGRLGAAMLRGLQSAGVAACAKHFPGHGDTLQDSHRELPRLPHGRARLDGVEFVPFRAAIAAGVATVMTAHVLFPELNPAHPSTLSKPSLALLRKDLRFRGVIVSDDLEMAAVAERYPVPEAAVLSIEAGCDLLLVCHKLERQLAAVEALARWADKSSAHEARLRDASTKVRDLAGAYSRGLPASFEPERLRRPEALALVSRLGAAAGADPTERAT